MRGNADIAVSEQVLDRSMYEPSRIMRSIQYLLDNDVIRIWRDSVLDDAEAPSGRLGETASRRLEAGTDSSPLV